MNRYIRDFCKRGFMFAWGGPVILAIVWAALQAAGVISTLSVSQVALGIISTTLLAFIAAGVSIVYQIETLPRATAGLIHASVLYIDYLGFYLLNGWIPADRIWAFTLIFIAVFVAIWLGIYFSVRLKVDRMNRNIHRA